MLSNPTVQIVKKVSPGESDQYFAYIISYFDRSDYQADGYEELDNPVDGVLTITVQVYKSGVALMLTKPVVHQVPLVDIDMSDVTDILVILKEGATELANRRIPWQDETETIIRPLPENWSPDDNEENAPVPPRPDDF